VAWIERRIGAARVVFTDRHGGGSTPPFDTANLGLAIGDDPARVERNRDHLAATLHVAEPGSWAWLRQVHGAAVAVVGSSPTSPPPVADGAVTAAEGLPLAVLVADCAPVALVSEGAVGVVHAGWRGLEAGVVQATVAALGQLASPVASPVDSHMDGHMDRGTAVRAVIGPCVRPDHYPFGPAELERLAARFGPSVRARARDGAPALDLAAAVRAALSAVGVTELDDTGVCTACSPDHFSHRRDGVTGRQALVVVRESRREPGRG